MPVTLRLVANRAFHGASVMHQWAAHMAKMPRVRRAVDINRIAHSSKVSCSPSRHMRQWVQGCLAGCAGHMVHSLQNTRATLWQQRYARTVQSSLLSGLISLNDCGSRCGPSQVVEVAEAAQVHFDARLTHAPPTVAAALTCSFCICWSRHNNGGPPSWSSSRHCPATATGCVAES